MLILIFLTYPDGFLLLQSANHSVEGKELGPVKDGTYLLGTGYIKYVTYMLYV